MSLVTAISYVINIYDLCGGDGTDGVVGGVVGLSSVDVVNQPP